MDTRAKYQYYLLSPRWAAKRQKIMARCHGICERCHHASATEVHHKTYLRIYRERLTDLLGLCRPCHRYIHGLQAGKKQFNLNLIDRDTILEFGTYFATYTSHSLVTKGSASYLSRKMVQSLVDV